VNPQEGHRGWAVERGRWHERNSLSKIAVTWYIGGIEGETKRYETRKNITKKARGGCAEEKVWMESE